VAIRFAFAIGLVASVAFFAPGVVRVKKPGRR